MKKIHLLVLACSAVCFVGQNLGCTRSNSEAVAAYRQFMDYWIVTPPFVESIVATVVFLESNAWVVDI